MKNGAKFFFLCLLVGGMLLTAQVFAAEEGSSSGQFKSELSEIDTRLATLEGQLKEVLANQAEIFERLDQLRIWVHRK